MTIYKAKVKWALGTTEIAVLSNEHDARSDLYSAAEVETKSKVATLRLLDVRRSNRRGIADWKPISRCISRGEQWGWVGYHTK